MQPREQVSYSSHFAAWEKQRQHPTRCASWQNAMRILKVKYNGEQWLPTVTGIETHNFKWLHLLHGMVHCYHCIFVSGTMYHFKVHTPSFYDQ
jgi:hypothetical protein